MQFGITQSVFSFFYPIACIYLGSTRSLRHFDIHQKVETDERGVIA
jgi:hypothetical protein